MAGRKHAHNPWWTIAFPLLAAALVIAYFAGLVPKDQPLFFALEAFILLGAVFAAVHHAEVVGNRVGEPFGSIILAVSVTIIEVGLIVALMLAADDGGPTIARDTVYSAVMLVLTGLIGLCLVAGGHKHYEQTIKVTGTSSYLAVLGTLAVSALILPNFTTSTAGPTYSAAQLTAVALVSVMLYAAFMFVQTVRHRDYFLAAADDVHAGNYEAPTNRAAGVSLAFLLVSLSGVVLLAKMLAPALDDLIGMAGLPPEFTGVVIAALVLAPESIAAVRASLANRPQTAINLALGSALASIALTIPVITILGAFANVQLALGVPPAKIVLLSLALFVSAITLLPGRTTVLQGFVHLGLFIMFIVVAAVP
ncbi:MAG: ionic transporter y4hA [Aestuariivirga sp.]|uniref:calcium:proton antiporter n=1 Tax=Aestuariivirga sp. TaxID=2650926 RepID=UPI0025C4BC03|nr:ionic transporter y4hA [Aestuariivirga sp.]MCA3561999.1 ionic transporter y4hA [Aestuariivirga sp.]